MKHPIPHPLDNLPARTYVVVMDELRVKAKAEATLRLMYRINVGKAPHDNRDFVDRVSSLLSEIFTKDELAAIARSLEVEPRCGVVTGWTT